MGNTRSGIEELYDNNLKILHEKIFRNRNNIFDYTEWKIEIGLEPSAVFLEKRTYSHARRWTRTTLYDIIPMSTM